MDIILIRKINKIIILILVALLFAFPQKAAASENYTLFRLGYDEAGKSFWQEEDTVIFSDNSEDNIKLAFNMLFSSKKENVYNFPENTRAKWVTLKDGNLTVNVTGDILNYGGKFYESTIMAQIIKTSLDIPGVITVTLLIENENSVLSEGGVIKEATNCELMEENIMN